MSSSDSIALSVVGDVYTTTGAYKRSICMAAASGNWAVASSFDKTHPNWTYASLNAKGDTALHIAVALGNTRFVEKLVKRTTNIEHLEILNTDGNTAFCIAAISGNIKIAKILFGKNPVLLRIRGQDEMLPIQLASLVGQLHMVKFLFDKTGEELLINLPFEDKVKLFFLTFTCNIYTFNKHATGYRDFLRLFFNALEEEDTQVLQSEKAKEAMFSAAKSGNFMVLDYLFNYNPNLFLEVNSQGENLLQIAISNRQTSVFRLIFHKGAYRNILALHVDSKGNNILHLAGKLAAEGRFGSPINQFIIHSEELWFQEVEKIVPPIYKTMKNEESMTPKDVFYKEHLELSEKAIIEVNGIANNYLFVEALMITLEMSAFLTIRTNDTSGKHPLFKEKIWYMIFLLSVEIGVSLCAVSMNCFTSVIVPSSWSPSTNYINSRLARMTFGVLFALAGFATFGIFGSISGVILIYSFVPNWVICVSVAWCGFTFAMFYVFLYRTLYVSARLTLALCRQYGATVLAKLGYEISWEPFFLD
ncbi:uncharacterized protein [Cicer arietinum]|uniref:uncharacterized protein isoform X2 n=1 Tax=Cicer arietinum TaxID=3827 RepID=UPI003CC63213